MKTPRVQPEKLSAIRNFIFGVQDGLGSTVGFLAGIAVGGVTQKTILLAGTVLILVEAFSMAISSLISEHTVQEIEERKDLPLNRSYKDPIIMFFSYAIAGFLTLAPYLFFSNGLSLVISIAISIVVLTATSIFTVKMFSLSLSHHLKQTLLIGVIAIVVGILVGKLFPY